MTELCCLMQQNSNNNSVELNRTYSNRSRYFQTAARRVDDAVAVVASLRLRPSRNRETWNLTQRQGKIDTTQLAADTTRGKSNKRNKNCTRMSTLHEYFHLQFSLEKVGWAFPRSIFSLIIRKEKPNRYQIQQNTVNTLQRSLTPLVVDVDRAESNFSHTFRELLCNFSLTNSKIKYRYKRLVFIQCDFPDC